MEHITLHAYGKINLALDTIGKRNDGYHLVRMIMQTVGVYDVITITKSKEHNGIRLTTNREDLPVNQDNLIYKAAQLIIDEFQISEGVTIYLEKNIPVAAGMAGGSTDCAATLIGMNQLFSLGLSKEELMKRGVTLGADVPYCIMGGTALSEGIGEVLTPLTDIVPCKVLLIKPNIDISTKWVYTTLKWDTLETHPDVDGMIDALNEHSLTNVANTLGNVLETVTIPANPVIQDIKDMMISLGALNSMMSGSGPTVFGLYTDETLATEAFQKCKALYPNFQVELTDFITREQIEQELLVLNN